ncbi:MAG: MotA/TolQ/ExbB proton channel family protein [Spirochaetia bacterium]|uniref:MotA/TolQ/ExbB proton channel family protein n=1 Tax=Treponema berlinense TaxID=225004 RepID=UPI0026F25AB1|nr:MotA/TolQ/ExbB proton channel family protein [Treponema berlinense]MDD5789041.1 MotA/TolQ/ExbB proton channel family protein [Spirochaetia bacterium]
MFNLIKSGGILIIPIILCGIAATYIIIERLIYFKNLRKADGVLKEQLKEVLLKKDYDAVQALCIAAETPFAQVVRKAVSVRTLEDSYLKEIVETEMEAVIPQYEHSLTLLGTIANISTLLGLFGTVTGNIKAFGVLGAGASMGNPAVLAGAIAEALVTTAAGLFVAIPSMIFSNYFTRLVNKEIVILESSVTEVVLKLTGHLL